MKVKDLLKNANVRKALVAAVGGALAIEARAVGVSLGTPELNEAAAVLVAIGLSAADHLVRTKKAAAAAPAVPAVPAPATPPAP